jgi:hypothetical protein
MPTEFAPDHLFYAASNNAPHMKSAPKPKELSAQARAELLGLLETRFMQNMRRHPAVDWHAVKARLVTAPGKLWSVSEMEKSGGEPDVVGHDQQSGDIIFMDCSAETPAGRTAVCYDREGLDSRKENKPKACATELAAAMGIELLTEREYHALQELGAFDTKTSSWVQTPPEMRKLGGGLFGDRRFGRVFIYHNGVQSYFSVRGFRGSLRV